MSKNVRSFRTFFDIFLSIWLMLLFGEPVQCSPVTTSSVPSGLVPSPPDLLLTYFSWWTFRPQQKICNPPPQKIPQFAADTLPAPRPLPLLETDPPPPGIFNKKNDPPPLAFFSIKKNRSPPPPGASDSPFPLPDQKKIKKLETPPSFDLFSLFRGFRAVPRGPCD